MSAQVDRSPWRRSRFWVAMAAAVGCAITAALGFWQLDRAAQKQALERQWSSRQAEPVLESRSLPDSVNVQAWEGVLWRRVRLQGQWQPSATLFLDNRQMQGRPGFFVLTPLRLQGSDRWVLVQRGWVPRRFDDRTALPSLPLPVGDVWLEGYLAPPPPKLYELGPGQSGAIRQNVDMASLESEFQLNLWPVSVLQNDAPGGPSPDTLQRDWPRYGAGVEKHHGYAFQWFGLSGLILILYVWFQLIAPRRRSPTTRG